MTFNQHAFLRILWKMFPPMEAPPPNTPSFSCCSGFSVNFSNLLSKSFKKAMGEMRQNKTVSNSKFYLDTLPSSGLQVHAVDMVTLPACWSHLAYFWEKINKQSPAVTLCSHLCLLVNTNCRKETDFHSRGRETTSGAPGLPDTSWCRAGAGGRRGSCIRALTATPIRSEILEWATYIDKAPPSDTGWVSAAEISQSGMVLTPKGSARPEQTWRQVLMQITAEEGSRANVSLRCFLKIK